MRTLESHISYPWIRHDPAILTIFVEIYPDPNRFQRLPNPADPSSPEVRVSCPRVKTSAALDKGCPIWAEFASSA